MACGTCLNFTLYWSAILCLAVSRSHYTGTQNTQTSARLTGRRELFDIFRFCIPWTRICKLMACPWLKNPYLIKKALYINQDKHGFKNVDKTPFSTCRVPNSLSQNIIPKDRSENAPRPCPYHDNVCIIIISAINVDKINEIKTCCLHRMISARVSLLHDLYDDAWSTEFSYWPFHVKQISVLP